ncbi:MAG: hypothetical protein GY953_36045, partial [bacterium]|nr:hypothetical protein [bacterium]
MLLVVVLVVDQLRNTPSVRAAELLDKAVVAAETVPVGPRGIRIRTSAGQITRVIEAAQRAAFSPTEERIVARIQPLFQAARYSWEDPLSARAFASWRNALASKQDEVTTVESPANCYQIRTTTDSSELVEATLRLRVDNLRPVEGTWRFRDREFVEITELDEAPAPAVVASPEIAEAAPAQVSEPVPVEPTAEAVRPATPGEELKVYALLRQLDADLGEPVEVTRDGGRVVVSGVGVNPALGQQIQDQLQDMPAVTVEFSDPQPAP